ncbi:MAG: single-stranded-DNA-specific exonuclease RecJ [candidate division WOR-3 bacterium]
MSLIQPEHNWQLPAPEPPAIAELAYATGLPLLIARLLYNRGCRTPADCEEFLNPSPARLHRPDTLPDIGPATERILSAVIKKEPVLVYGDYDVDGICGTAILITVLKWLGVPVNYYLPHRHTEGYGVSRAGVEFAIKNRFRLMITNDCGSTDIQNLTLARNAGIDVIVTDHHEPGPVPPPALAFVNPKRADSGYPFRELAGAGVAFKLAWQLLSATNRSREELISLLDLVGLATIADIVPLVGENRIIAWLGIAALNKTARPGIRMLMELSRLNPRKLSTRDIAFILAPRLNAAGRIGHARTALELLLTDNETTARGLAQQLEEFNRSRQQQEDLILNEARRLIELAKKYERRVLVLAHPNWNEGVIGIVAAKLVDEFWRPCILITLYPDIGKGSARSVSGFNLHEALNRTSAHLLNFGGHRYAAGIKIKPEQIANFEKSINDYAAELPASIFQPTLKIEAGAELREITPELMEYLARLQPFGPDNPEPVFVSTGLEVVGYPRRIGKNRDHLKFRVRAGNIVLPAIAWQRSRDILNLRTGQPGHLDICYTLTADSFNGTAQLLLNVLDLKTNPER